MYSDGNGKLNMPEYHLYVVLPESIPPDEKHYLITPDYSLLYTPNTLEGESCAEVKDLSALPASAWEWLTERINMIRAEYIIAHKAKVLKKKKKLNREFLDLVQKAAEDEHTGKETELKADG